MPIFNIIYKYLNKYPNQLRIHMKIHITNVKNNYNETIQLLCITFLQKDTAGVNTTKLNLYSKIHFKINAESNIGLYSRTDTVIVTITVSQHCTELWKGDCGMVLEQWKVLVCP